MDHNISHDENSQAATDSSGDGTSLHPTQLVPGQRISSEFPPLTVEDVEALRAGNTSDERIREIAARHGTKREQKKVSKKDLTTVFAESREWLLEQSGGKPLFSGKIAGTLLIRAGYYAPVRGFNAFGDKLGKHGHNLPSVVIDSARRYDITYIGRNAEEKESRQQYFGRTQLDVLRELIATLKENGDVATAAE